MRVLVTGGAGYIGSHTVLELTEQGHEPIIIDNLANSSREAVNRIQEISGKQFPFYEVDCCDQASLYEVFDKEHFDAVIHFAGLKAVGESVADPLRYYQNNLDSTLALCEAMKKHGVRKLIFSSSATVYGIQDTPQYTEDMQRRPVNPYGQTKAMIEQILEDLSASDDSWRITALRYFNPVGAHASGLIGEDPQGIPNNLFPFVAQVAAGTRPEIKVFGDDYDTPDGTGVRDYIHVADLASGHLAALDHMEKADGFNTFNLGAGEGKSVLEVIKAFEKACGKPLPYRVVDRRPGDLPIYFADANKAKHKLKWQTSKSLEDACRDSWNWQSKNPDGYR